MDVTSARGAGQTFPRLIPSDSRVFVAGNLPSDFPTPGTLTTLVAIMSVVSDITLQVDYTRATLCNSDGLPSSITVIGSTATVNVSLKPLISRLELSALEGSGSITSFTVDGVYVDDYYSHFTIGGSYSGTKFEQGNSGTYGGSSFYSDEGIWTAGGTPLRSVPDDGDVWAYNVSPGSLPRLLLRLSGVKYNPGTGEIDAGSCYLTVTGYTNLGASTFERGKIYRLSGIVFDIEDAGLTPNPVDINLTANVSVEEWVIVSPDAEL